MHQVALAERVRVGVAHAPGEPGARDRVVLAVHDVADPADRLAERDADDRDVEHEAARQAQRATGEVARDRRADRRAHGADPAAPERQGVQRTRLVERPVVGDVSDPRADQSPDDDRDREGEDAVVPHEVARAAERDPAAGEHADEREERVP